jgi:hypothetical protein
LIFGQQNDLRARLPWQKWRQWHKKIGNSSKLAFITINTNDFELAKKNQLNSEDSLCYQMFVKPDAKKLLVDCLQIKRVPHLVMLDQQGNVLMNGKQFDWERVSKLAGIEEVSVQPLANTPASPTPAFSFSLDEDF